MKSFVHTRCKIFTNLFQELVLSASFVQGDVKGSAFTFVFRVVHSVVVSGRTTVEESSSNGATDDFQRNDGPRNQHDFCRESWS